MAVRARKPVPTRLVLEPLLWILNTGAQWHMLPQCYPNYKTVHRRFQTLCRNPTLPTNHRWPTASRSFATAL